VISPAPSLPTIRRIDPATKAVLVAVRQALLIIAAALAIYCELPDKGVR